MKWVLVIMMFYTGAKDVEYKSVSAMPDEATCFLALERLRFELAVSNTSKNQQGSSFLAFCIPENK